MAIWFGDFPLSDAQERSHGTLIEHLGIEVLEAGEDHLRARMPVDARTRQPAGMRHGGASVALAETLASWAASFCVDPSKHHCVGSCRVLPARFGRSYARRFRLSDGRGLARRHLPHRERASSGIRATGRGLGGNALMLMSPRLDRSQSAVRGPSCAAEQAPT